jgi:hypothetical protein
LSQTQTSGGVYSGVSVMLGSHLVLDRLAEWIEWLALAVNHGCGLSCYAAAARPEYRKKFPPLQLGLPHTGDRMGSSLRLGSD